MSSNDADVYSYLTGKGLNPSAAAGVMGNLEAESSMNPGITNSIGAFGLAQWLGGRKKALINYANARGLSPSSLQAQLGYLWQEISSGGEGVTPASLNAAGSPSAAAALFDDKFERPGSSDTSKPAREKYANQFYNQFSGTTSPIQGTGGVGSDTLPGLTQTSTEASHPKQPLAYPTGKDAGNDIIGVIDQSLQIKSFEWQHPVTSILDDTRAIALRTVLVIIGLILLIFGLLAVVEKAGVNLVV